MYIADTTPRGLHHLVYEVVDNSIDETMAGYASEISVIINNDGSVTVEDNGRGIPVEQHPDLGFSTLQGVMTVLKFAASSKKGAYQTSGGLHGVGVTVVNFPLRMVRSRSPPPGPPVSAGIRARRAHRRGAAHRADRPPRHQNTFKADPLIFPNTNFQYNLLIGGCRVGLLNRGVKIIYRDQRTGEGETFCYQRGILEFVEHLNRATEPAHEDIIYVSGHTKGWAWRWPSSIRPKYTENVHSYVNNICTTEGRHPCSGFRAAITRNHKPYGKKEGQYKDLIPSGDDCREGLTASFRSACQSRSSKARLKPSSATAR